MLQNKSPQRLEEDEVRPHCWCTFRLLQASPGRAHSSWSSSRAVDLKDSQNILFNTPVEFSSLGNNISRPCLEPWDIHKGVQEDCHDSRPLSSFLGPGKSLQVSHPLISFSLPRKECWSHHRVSSQFSILSYKFWLLEKIGRLTFVICSFLMKF